MLDFPNSPTTGQVFGNWKWDGAKWVTTGGGGGGGGAVSADALNLATLGSDSLIYVPDAAHDGSTYGRVNGAWNKGAPLASPALTGTPTAPTAAPGTNTTQLATTAFVAAASSGSGGALVAYNNYTASGTITVPAGATKALVKMWGGSGGTGGAGGGSTCSGGGGSGSYLEKYLTGLTPGSTLTFTFGAAGAGGAIGTGTGTNGGNTVLASGTQTIGTLTAGGGGGTPGGVASFASGGAGGVASGGDLNRNGQAGGSTFNDTTSGDQAAGTGGSLMYSVGGLGQLSNAAGNPGTPGGCIINWYS